MKQKNLILMVVAVGCGLLAAFLTSQMSAKPAAVPQTVEVLMVAKELPPGTKITAESIKDQFKKKQFDPANIPEKAVVSEDMLVEKTLNKTLRADTFVIDSDLGNYTPISPPEGKHIVAIRLPVEGMTPFVQPSSKVDLMATRQLDGNKVKGTVLIPNVLVMAVDTKVTAPQGGAQGDLGLQMVSVAVTREEAMAIRLAQAAQAKLSFILRNNDGASNPNEKFDLDKSIAWLNNDGAQGDNGSETKKPEEKISPESLTTKILVPTTDLKAGTELTSDVIDKNFKELAWNGPAPATAIVNIKENLGHFLLKDVAADQFVPKSYVAAKMPTTVAAAEPGRGKADEGSKPQVKPDVPPTIEMVPLKTFDRTFTTVKGTIVLRYEIQKDGTWKFLRDVTSEVNPATMEPKADEAPAPSKKTI